MKCGDSVYCRGMKNIPLIASLALFIAIFSVIPYAVGAQQRTLTVGNLQATHATETAFLNQKILNTKADYKVLGCTGNESDKMQCYQDNIEIAKAQDDLHTVQLAYQLVLNSLK